LHFQLNHFGVGTGTVAIAIADDLKINGSKPACGQFETVACLFAKPALLA
jgi:hypothetical protein